MRVLNHDLLIRYIASPTIEPEPRKRCSRSSEISEPLREKESGCFADVSAAVRYTLPLEDIVSQSLIPRCWELSKCRRFHTRDFMSNCIRTLEKDMQVYEIVASALTS